MINTSEGQVVGSKQEAKPSRVFPEPYDDDEDEADYDDDEDDAHATPRPERWISRSGFGSPEWWSRQ